MSELLARPLAFIDTETTGTSTSKDRIVELSVHIVYPGTQGGDRPAPFSRTRRLNPTIPIPAEATAVHGISDGDVRDAPTFASLAKDLWKLLDPCDIVGFNVRRFDLPILRAEFRRCGLTLDPATRAIIDLQYLFHLREPRDLASAVRHYLGREHVAAHSAAGDTVVLPELLEAQLLRYPDLPRDMQALHKVCDEFAPFRSEVEVWFGDDLKKPVFQRGKHRGRTLEDVYREHAQYIGWMLSGAEDMDDEVKDFLRRFRQEVSFDGLPRHYQPEAPKDESRTLELL